MLGDKIFRPRDGGIGQAIPFRARPVWLNKFIVVLFHG
jgi:hypothetical protein